MRTSVRCYKIWRSEMNLGQTGFKDLQTLAYDANFYEEWD